MDLLVSYKMLSEFTKIKIKPKSDCLSRKNKGYINFMIENTTVDESCYHSFSDIIIIINKLNL